MSGWANIAWADMLQSASWRGVIFGVETGGLEGGRRVAIHEFPQKDVPYVEDLGRKARSFSVDAFVVGPDYMTDRNALLNALEQSGPGTLVHPWFGTLNNLQVQTFSLQESRDNGGMATFSITFTETSDITFPEAVSAATDNVQIMADNVQGALATMAAGAIALAPTGRAYTNLPVYNTPASTSTAVSAAVLSEAENVITDTKKIYDTCSRPVAKQSNKIDDYLINISRLETNVIDLLKHPANLAYQIVRIVDRATEMLSEPVSIIKKYKRAYDDLTAYFGTKNYPATGDGACMAANTTALKTVILLTVASAAARIGVNTTYESRQQALDTRAMLLTMIDGAIGGTTDDALYQGAIALRSAIVQALPPAGNTLKDVQSVTVDAAMPSLALCYNIYGDLDSEQDMLTRNHIENPFCIPGGSTIEVLE